MQASSHDKGNQGVARTTSFVFWVLAVFFQLRCVILTVAFFQAKGRILRDG